MSKKKLTLLVLLTYSISYGLPKWCERIFPWLAKKDPVDIKVAHNPTIKDATNLTLPMKPEEYPQEAGRGPEELTSFFGDGFETFILNVNEGDKVLDVGAGYGFFGLKLARTKVDSLNISAHDFWSVLEQISKLDPKNVKVELEPGDSLRVSKINNLNQAVVNSLANLFKNNKLLDHYDFQLRAGYGFYLKARKMKNGVEVEGKKELAEKFIKAAKEMVKEKEVFSKHYQYVVGDAEEVLSKLNANAKLIVDCYGATFYSANVPRLLELHEKNLKVGGRAYVYMYTYNHISKEPERQLMVRLKGGTKIPLVDYLAKKYPDTFKKHVQKSVTGLNTVSLVIHKRSNGSLDLGLKLDPSSVRVDEKNAVEAVYDVVE